MYPLIEEFATNFKCAELKVDLKEYSSMAEKKIKKFEEKLWDRLLECLDEDHKNGLRDMIEAPNRMDISSTLLLN